MNRLTKPLCIFLHICLSSGFFSTLFSIFFFKMWKATFCTLKHATIEHRLCIRNWSKKKHRFLCFRMVFSRYVQNVYEMNVQCTSAFKFSRSMRSFHFYFSKCECGRKMSKMAAAFRQIFWNNERIRIYALPEKAATVASKTVNLLYLHILNADRTHAVNWLYGVDVDAAQKNKNYQDVLSR